MPEAVAHNAAGLDVRVGARQVGRMDAAIVEDWPPRSVAAMRRALQRWYEPRRATLPWRRTRDSYRIWVSEVMLQQTRIAVVVPAYERFIERFPDVASLAEASEEEVLAHWSGLGYYTRARSLRHAARELHARGAVAFPDQRDVALALPGVGPYTAAAVLSIAHGQAYAAVDGNVVRVLSRLGCLPMPDSRQQPHAALAQHLLDPSRPGDWNQALMEIGQEVCLPRQARCEACPLRRWCASQRTGRVDEFPQRGLRRKAVHVAVALTVVHDGAGRFLLERGAFPYLRHLWLPLSGEVCGPTDVAIECGEFAHAIVHRRFAVRVFERRVSRGALLRQAEQDATGERRIFDLAAIAALGRSSLLTKAFRAVGFEI